MAGQGEAVNCPDGCKPSPNSMPTVTASGTVKWPETLGWEVDYSAGGGIDLWVFNDSFTTAYGRNGAVEKSREFQISATAPWCTWVRMVGYGTHKEGINAEVSVVVRYTWTTSQGHPCSSGEETCLTGSATLTTDGESFNVQAPTVGDGPCPVQ